MYAYKNKDRKREKEQDLGQSKRILLDEWELILPGTWHLGITLILSVIIYPV